MRTDGPRATGGAAPSPKRGLLAPPPWKKRWEFLSGLARLDAGSDRERALAWAGQHLFSPGLDGRRRAVWRAPRAKRALDVRGPRVQWRWAGRGHSAKRPCA